MSHADASRPPARRVALTLAILALIAAAALFVGRPLLGGADPSGPHAAGPAAIDIPEDTLQTSTLVAQEEALPIETYEIFLVRDPFSPVRPATVTGGGGTGGETTGGDTTGGTTGGTTGDTTGGTTGETTGDTTGGTGDGCRSDGDVQVCDGRVVSVVDVFVDGSGEPVARIQVDSELYDVQDGAVFAVNFEVLGIDPPCVTLLFGDDAFTLCEGDRVLK